MACKRLALGNPRDTLVAMQQRPTWMCLVFGHRWHVAYQQDSCHLHLVCERCSTESLAWHDEEKCGELDLLERGRVKAAIGRFGG